MEKPALALHPGRSEGPLAAALRARLRRRARGNKVTWFDHLEAPFEGPEPRGWFDSLNDFEGVENSSRSAPLQSKAGMSGFARN